ncbi:MAG: MotA/TolQ/ExbB proton channel family protein [Candidatus Latescibacteria bacterium]|nr:MotA/TolQ/ExbB proton channel family protein [Candidatus Latescibacterota bacterium]
MDPYLPPNSTGFFSIIFGLGFFAKIIVLILVVFSIISWAIIIKKFFVFKRVKKNNDFLYRFFKDRKSVAEFVGIADQYPNSHLAKLVFAGIEEWRRIIKDNQTNKQVPAPEQADSLIKLLPNINETLERTTSREIDWLEQNLGFLATTGSVAPFLGLLGTVWGILSAFLSVRHIPVVTLQVIAPGISDALVTTVVGLLVAIPAVVAYNYYIGKVKNFANEMDRWSLEITGDFRKTALGPESKN